MKKTLILAAACLVASLAQAAPVLSGHWQLGVAVRPYQALSQQPNTMYNPRYFNGDIYATEISGPTFRCFGRYHSGSSTFLGGGIPAVNEHRMLALLHGPGGVDYLMGSGGDNGSASFIGTFTRYNLDGTSPVVAASVDNQVVEGFDFVDDNTIISTCYTSGNRKRLYLSDVVAEPFSITRNTTWNANGYVETPVNTRIRNVRVGDVYSGFAYFGDAGNNASPKFYAINLANGACTELGSLGTLTGGGSFGLWTVIERGGYLYVHTTDNGIYVYNMVNATTLGSLFTTYTKAELDAATGLRTVDQYYGLDVSPDGKKLLLGAPFGTDHELHMRAPIASGNWQLGVAVRPCDDLGQQQNTTYNPRYFDGEIYATQISGDIYRCFGRYAAGTRAFLGGAIPAMNEHRMLGRLRGTAATYLVGTGGANNDGSFFWFFFTRYDSDLYASNPANASAVDDQVSESFDWVDDDTMISTCYMSGNRKRLYLTDVAADSWTLTRNITWNANGYVETPVSTRIRNVRVGDVFKGFAYFGDAGNNASPKFYAINLANGACTELGSLGALTGTGSFGLWTVVERGGYLYVQTTDNGIYVYNMVNATTLGSLVTTYTKAELDAATANTTAQYFGLDVSPGLSTLLLGGLTGSVYELAPVFRLGISRSETDVILSWPAAYAGVVVQSSSDLSAGFTDMSPQPSVARDGNLDTATLPASGAKFFRLRK